jgi:hypothetical protein
MKTEKTVAGLIVCVVILISGCSTEKYQQAEHDISKPINCATAAGDIRMLQHEKAHTMDKISQGVSAISPAGAVIGMVKGTEHTSMKVASGDYNKMIDKRIAEIKAQCGIR